jgi:hypothetical protein
LNEVNLAPRAEVHPVQDRRAQLSYGGAVSVLIICEPADLHACAVAWALAEKGVDSVRWHPAPPWALPGSVRFGAGAVDYRFAGTGGEIAPSTIDSVWMRRPSRPVFPDDLGESDRRASLNELHAYHGGVLELLPKDILWANPLGARASANFKLRQLAVAVSLGIPVPRTLVTDDSAQARDFVAAHPEGTIVYKPFHSFHWQQPNDDLYQSVTTPVAAADFHDPEALIWSPGIFQAFVPKAFELRVSIFGRTCVAAKIFDQDPIDWRTRQRDMKVAPFALPGAVEAKLLALMERLGLVMGMADLIVTPDGDYVFLEVNEQGQFLWVEDMCPDLPLLDTAARFLAGGDPRFAVRILPGEGPTYRGFVEAEGESFGDEKLSFLRAGGILGQSLLKDRPDPSREKAL